MTSDEKLMQLPLLTKASQRAEVFKKARENIGKEIEILEHTFESEPYRRLISGISELDPKLAKLLESADQQRRAGLQQVFDYVSHLTDN